MNPYDVLTIGAGPAGLSAAIYATRAKLNALTLEASGFGGQIAKSDLIENYPGTGALSGAELVDNMHQQAQQLGAQFSYDEVLGIEKAGGLFHVKTASEVYDARTVLLAMGAKPAQGGFDGEERFTGHGVSYCATCDAMFYRDKEVFVIGGGDSAIQEALFLTKFASHVSVLIRKNYARAAKTLQEKAKNNEKIDLIFNTKLVKLDGGNLPSKLVLEDTQTHEQTIRTFDEGSVGVFVFVGARPQTQLVSDMVVCDESGYIQTDEYMRTNLDGMFAAGDIRTTPLRQVVTAAADGAIAITSIQKYLDMHKA